ncbi:MAG: hypothetical protein U0872_05925 [Planctomycetaceae bacterium]
MKLTFEHFSDPLSSRLKFLLRLIRNFLASIGIILGSLLIGMAGYRHYEGMSWVDAFLNASMLLSGMGPLGSPATESGKIFAGMYALYSGFVVILASGIVLAPVVHRFLHRFHLSGEHRKRPANHSTSKPETPHEQISQRPA